jgi:hypothetical protein
MTDQPSLPKWRATEPFVGKFNIQYGRGVIVESATKPGPNFVALDASAVEFVAPPKKSVEGEPVPPMGGLYFVGRQADGSPKWSTRPPIPDVVQSVQDNVVPRYQYKGESAAAMIAGDLRRRYESFDSLFWPTEPGMEPVNEPARQVLEYYEKNHSRPDLPFHAWSTERNCVNTIESNFAKGHTPTPSPGPRIPPRTYSRDANDPKYRGDR